MSSEPQASMLRRDEQSSSLEALNDAGIALYSAGRLDEAESKFGACLAEARRKNIYREQAAALGNLGMIFADRGRYHEAERAHREAIELSENYGPWPVLEANQLGNLGILAMERGDFRESQQRLWASLNHLERLGDREGIANTLFELAKAIGTSGNPEKAIGLLQEAARMTYALGLNALGKHVRLHWLLLESNPDPHEYRKLVCTRMPEAERRPGLKRLVGSLIPGAVPRRRAQAMRWASVQVEAKLFEELAAIAQGEDSRLDALDFEAALAHFPVSPRILLAYAQWLDVHGRNDEAVDLLYRRRNVTLTDYELTCQLVWALVDTNRDLDQAERLLSALRRQRENWVLADTEAWLRYRRGHYREAFAALEPVLPYANQRPDIAYHAGAIYAALGYTAEALAYLGAALVAAAPFSGRVAAQSLHEELRP